MCATGGGKKRRATHDYSHSTFLRGTRCHNYPRGTFTSRSPAAGRFVLLFCITPALFCDEKKMACFDLIWHCCGRDCRGSGLLYSRCRMWLILPFPRPVPGLRSARSSYPSLILRVLDRRWSTRLGRKRSTFETLRILPRAPQR